MKKFKKWFINHYLPAFCKEKLTEENERLKTENAELKAENDRLEAYIYGMEKGLRAVKKIQIINRGD